MTQAAVIKITSPQSSQESLYDILNTIIISWTSVHDLHICIVL